MESTIEQVLNDSLNFMFQKDRLKTYQTWIFSNDVSCNVKKMAEAGFIFIGNEEEPDAVKCFFCDKHLDGWEETDNPWKEHLKHAPQCLFAQLQKPEDDVLLKEFLLLRKELVEKVENSYLEQLHTIFKKCSKKIESKLKK